MLEISEFIVPHIFFFFFFSLFGASFNHSCIFLFDKMSWKYCSVQLWLISTLFFHFLTWEKIDIVLNINELYQQMSLTVK